MHKTKRPPGGLGGRAGTLNFEIDSPKLKRQSAALQSESWCEEARRPVGDARRAGMIVVRAGCEAPEHRKPRDESDQTGFVSSLSWRTTGGRPTGDRPLRHQPHKNAAARGTARPRKWC
jgi:hypothetical protein